MTARRKILSIDGGGIRGILPATILAYIEKRLQEKTKNPHTRLQEYFDFFSGTSTGAILISTYLYPSRSSASSKYTAQDALNIYLKCGSSIFERSWVDKLRSLGGLWKERYDAGPLEKYLKLFFKDTSLKNLLQPCLLTSYDIEKKSYHFFKTYAAQVSPKDNFTVQDACRASSAAPTFFSPAHIQNEMGTSFTLVDGAVLANNPGLCALTEAIDYYSTAEHTKYNIVDFELYSFGTAKNQQTYTYDQVKEWGGIGWLLPILDIMMSGVSEVSERQLNILYSASDGLYHRIQPSLSEAIGDMDAATPENIQALQNDAWSYIHSNTAYLEDLMDHWIATKPKRSPLTASMV